MNTNTTPSNCKAPERFSASHLAGISTDLQSAHAILKIVTLAMRAEEDGSMGYAGVSGAAHWSPAIGEVVTRLDAVRDRLMNTIDNPALDWTVALGLAQALDAALWAQCNLSPGLTLQEAQDAIRVTLEAIAKLQTEVTALNLGHGANLH